MKNEDNKVQKIAAGEVITIWYYGDNKPCDRCMALLLNHVETVKGKAATEIYTAYGLNLETNRFIGTCSYGSVRAEIEHVKDKKTKAWFFKKVLELNQEETAKKQSSIANEDVSITREILLKNGFVEVNEKDGYFALQRKNGEYPFPFFIEYIISNRCLYINDGLVPRPICNVGQLQFVFKLIGIEKEVVL